MLVPRRVPLAEPSFWVELSPCTGGDSGGQSLGDVGRIGGHAGRRARVARRMVAEGSRSRTIILRITQQTYLTFGDSYWTYNLFITARPHQCHCACCRRWEPLLYQTKSSNSDRSLEVHLLGPRDPTPSNSPPSKKVQQNLTFTQTHHQPHQRPSRTSRPLQYHTRSTLVPVGLAYTAAFTQSTHFSGTRRPRARQLSCSSHPVHRASSSSQTVLDETCALAEDG